MKFAALVLAALACSIAHAKDAALEIRFHPATARPYAAASERGLASLLVQNTAIINREAQPLTVTAVEFEILTGDTVVETRRLSAQDIARAAAGGAQLQASGMLELLAFQFGAEKLLPPAAKLRDSHTLAPGDALYIGPQMFVYRGARDRVRVRVQATVAGEALDATLENYFERVKQVQRQRLARGVRGVRGVVGNHVVIEHADGEHSVYAHLKPGSLKVKAGDRVAMGQPLASVGTSGNSTEPHLHFHVADGPDAMRSAGIPVRFESLHIRNADFPRPPQTGDFVEHR